ncbi:MAG TPA: glucose-1-phosphate adenylyltransferase, partial [Pseudonocardia sp.]|nr:glucose-1-phosphate adenylyltransferase [Pseudonocardia sp.]
GAVVQESVLADGVRVGAGAVVRRAILDKNVTVPAGAHVGVDMDRDRACYHVSDSGVVVLGKGTIAES